MFLASLDFSVNVGLPDIARSLDANVTAIYQIITVYLGATATVQLILGRIADVYGLKLTYIVGLLAYGIAVLLIGIAATLDSVIMIRILQAMGNAVFLALSPAIVTASAPDAYRGQALGWMTAIGMSGMILGSLGAGFVIDHYGWRWIFLARVPLTIIALGMAIWFLPTIRKASEADLDSPSALLIVASILFLMLYLHQTQATGWLSLNTNLYLAISIVAVYCLIRRQMTISTPFIPSYLLRQSEVSLGLVCNFLMYFAIFVNWFVLPFFAAEFIGMGPASIGVLLTIPAACLLVSSPLGGAFADHTHPAFASTVGMFIIVAFLTSFQTVDNHSTGFAIAVRMAGLGIGMGIFQSSNLSLIMGNVGTRELGIAGGLSGLSRNLGTVISVVLLGAIFVALKTSGQESVELTSPHTREAQATYIAAFKFVYAIAAVVALLGFLLNAWLWQNRKK
jgi:MFS family permease